MTESAKRPCVIAIMLAWTVVQWFVANLAIGTSSTAHVPLSEKVAWGLRRVGFQETRDSESAVLVTIGMLMIPVLIGAGQLGATLAWRVMRSRVSGPFPRIRVLLANWIWLVYWPLWLLSTLVLEKVWLVAPLSYRVSLFFVWIGGALVIPPLVALAVGFFVIRRFSLTSRS